MPVRPMNIGPRQQFLAGVRAELPILLGVAPFGMIYGLLARDAGLGPAASQAMSSVVFAGSAQFVMAQLFALPAPGVVIVLTAFLVNLRHLLYSASVAPYFHHLPARWRWLLAYLLTDEAYAVSIVHFRHGRRPTLRHWYFLGTGLALWSTWQLSTAAGVFLGAQVPPDWSLDFTLAVTFIALVVPALHDRPSIAAAAAAGLTVLLAQGLPFRLGLVLAAAVGIAAGLLVDYLQGTLRPEQSTAESGL
ncbi:MAG: AzlC family ABC transporter permease [Candidatus Promineifilaceae bacterium]|nr:AzlC family ABC transporter permease [Candidatus Promineifilaceae bacterium]